MHQSILLSCDYEKRGILPSTIERARVRQFHLRLLPKEVALSVNDGLQVCQQGIAFRSPQVQKEQPGIGTDAGQPFDLIVVSFQQALIVDDFYCHVCHVSEALIVLWPNTQPHKE